MGEVNEQKCTAQCSADPGMEFTVNAAVLKDIIKKTILEQKKVICENPKAMKIEGDKVVMIRSRKLPKAEDRNDGCHHRA